MTAVNVMPDQCMHCTDPAQPGDVLCIFHIAVSLVREAVAPYRTAVAG